MILFITRTLFFMLASLCLYKSINKFIEKDYLMFSIYLSGWFVILLSIVLI